MDVESDTALTATVQGQCCPLRDSLSDQAAVLPGTSRQVIYLVMLSLSENTYVDPCPSTTLLNKVLEAAASTQAPEGVHPASALVTNPLTTDLSADPVTAS